MTVENTHESQDFVENTGERSRASQPQRLSLALSGPRRYLPAGGGDSTRVRGSWAILKPRLAVASRRCALPALRPFG